MKIEIPHELTKEAAREKIKGLLTDLKQQYAGQVKEIEENWTDYTNEFKLGLGPLSTNGTIVVNDKTVAIDLAIPFFASMYKNQIQSLIEAQAKKALG